MRRIVVRTLGGVILVALLVVGGLYAYAEHDVAIPSIATQARLDASPATIERGRYLVTSADCIACHTMPKGKPFAGGLALDSPVGQIYSTNITPDRKNGIGDYTLDDFDHALRHGIAKRGDTLYPAMPFPSYAHMTPDDIAAMYAYLMHDVEPVDSPNHDTKIRWPLSARWPLAIWRKLFGPAPAVPATDRERYADPRIARGAYLVQGPGHCGSCHTPRAVTMQEKALDDTSPLYLSGGMRVDGWVPVNLRGSADGLGSWSVDDIVASLKTGRNATHAVIGSAMSDVVFHSLQYLSDDDLGAIAVYLKSLPGDAGGPSYVADPRTANELRNGINPTRGAELYVDNCAACHATSGLGRTHALPAIAGNSSVLTKDPGSMIRLILAGSELPATAEAPSALGMPAFGWRLSDAETAELLSFVRNSWGNHAPAVSAAQVRRIRAALEAEDTPQQ